MRVYLLLVAVIAVVAASVVMVQRPALAGDPDRTIPTIVVSSPATGEIQVAWDEPHKTDTLSSYRVSWALWAEDGFTSYKDENSNTGGNAYPDAPASSYTITGVAPGEYAVYVRARYDDYQNGPFIKSSKVVVADAAAQEDDTATPTPEPTEAPTATPDPTPDPTPEPTSRPGDVTGLTMTSSRPGHLWISWDASVPAPSEYRLNWAPVDEPFPAWDSNQGGNLWREGTALDFSNIVEAGVTYKFRMRAIYTTGDNAPAGPWSDTHTERVRNHPPGAPTGLSVDSATHDGVVLSWSAPGHSALTGYRIQRGSDADALETIVEDTGNLQLTYTDTTTADDATYHYAIIALSLDGDSAQSGTVSATTPPRTPVTPVIEGAPGAPSTLTAQLDGSGGVTLSWTDPDDSAITGYRILRGVDARSMRIIVENTGSATVGYTDATAAVNTAHVYAVQARNSVGLSQLSNTVSITTLSAPTELDVSASSGRVALSWSAPDLSAITGYRVMRGSTASSLNQVAVVSGRSNTFYTDFDVLPLRQYHYAVRALNAQGSSPLSETISATTQPVTAVSRFLRFDEGRQVVIQQDQDTPTPITLVSNEGRPNAVTYASDDTTSESFAFSQTRTPSKESTHVSFRTGPQPGGYNLTSLSATLRRTPSSVEEPNAQVRILADNNGLPGSVVHTLSDVTLTTTRSRVSFTAPAGATLEPNTTYWAQFNEISLSSVLGGHPQQGITYSIRQIRHSLDDACSVPGWSIGDDNYVTYPDSSIPSTWAASVTANQGPAAPKIAILGSPVDGSVSENRCHDLPQADTTTGELPIGGGVVGSLYPDSLDPTDRDWIKVTLEADVLYQFDVFHSRRVNGREGTTIGSARVHRILDSTGAAVTSDVSLQGAPAQRSHGRPDLLHAHRRRRLLPRSWSRQQKEPDPPAGPARQLGHLHRAPARPHAPGARRLLHSGEWW